MHAKIFLVTYLFFCIFHDSLGQNSNQNQGIEIITSGGKAADSLFIRLVKERDLKVIFIPTAASSLRSESGVIWNPDSLKNKDAFKKELLKRFNLTEITVLHTRNHNVANSDDFLNSFEGVKAVWISGGNPGRFMEAYRGTRLIKELKNIIERGGIIAGESAGAIVQGSYTIRGNPNKPVLMVRGNEKGIGLLSDVAINPHLSGQKRENELITIIDKYPKLLGIGVDDNTGFVISNGIGEVFGTGRIAIYDNKKYKEGWYYWLKPGDKFDFINKVPLNIKPE